MIRLAALLALVLSAGPALAETQWTPPEEIRKAAPPEATQKPQRKPVAAFGDDHPDCAEWTDGCIVCKREDGDEPACSMPGVACLPAEPECLKPKP